MPLKLRPLSDRVIVQRDKGKTKAKYGLLIPSTAVEKPQFGEVTAVGPGAYSEIRLSNTGPWERMPMHVEEGMRILFGRYSGTEIEIEEEEYVVLRQTDILCIVEEDEDAEV